MGLIGGAVALAMLVLVVHSLVDIVLSPETSSYGVPKPVWLILVVLLPLAGSIAWLVVSRRTRAATRTPPAGPTASRPSAPDPMSEADYRRRLRDRVEEQRRRARARPEPREPGAPE